MPNPTITDQHFAEEDRRMTMPMDRRESIGRSHQLVLRLAAFATAAAALIIQPTAEAASRSAKLLAEPPRQHVTQRAKDLKMAENKTPPGAAEMAAAKTITMKVLAIGTWTAKAPPESRPAIMPSEARDTMRLMLAGKIDQWFAKTDGSGAVFLMNVTDAAEAHTLLENLPLGKADMMTFQLIPVGPLWPLGLLLGEPAK
jgi:hypothetical protein